MSQIHPLANYPFKITIKGEVRYTNLLSLTHGRIISLSTPDGFERISIDDIDAIEVEDHTQDTTR